MSDEQDRRAIERLMHEYAYRFDSGDVEGFAALFAHGTLHLTGLAPAATGAGAVKAAIDGLVIFYDGTPRTNHLIHNVQIDLDADGQGASACSYVEVLQGVPGVLPVQIIATGIYLDRFARHEGEWVFAHRKVRGSLLGDMSHHVRVALAG